MDLYISDVNRISDTKNFTVWKVPNFQDIDESKVAVPNRFGSLIYDRRILGFVSDTFKFDSEDEMNAWFSNEVKNLDGYSDIDLIDIPEFDGNTDPSKWNGTKYEHV